MQVANAGTGHLLPLRLGGWITKQHLIVDVALHLPDVGRMRLGDVDDVESNTVLILLVKLVERGNLPAKWRSSVAAENQRNGFGALEGRHCYAA